MIVLCGLGGIFTEIIKEKKIWFVPVDKKEVEKDLGASSIGKVFIKGGLSVRQLADQVEKISQIAMENESIKELDINPIFFYKDRNPIAVDIKGVIG